MYNRTLSLQFKISEIKICLTVYCEIDFISFQIKFDWNNKNSNIETYSIEDILVWRCEALIVLL